MKIFYLGCGWFFAAFFIQWALWKIRLPQRQAKTLLILFGLIWLTSLALVWMVSSDPDHWAALQNPAEYLHYSFLYIALTLAYLNTYPGLEADSPSLVIVMTIHQGGEEGVAVEKFYETLTDDLLVKPRIRDLLVDKMATLDDGKYRLTRKGRLLAVLFGAYRSLLKAPKGG
ncbi:MAG: hypothetical protein G3M78_08005 [Candidatus Nitrohelix vancouverensis]|uniref:Uncharacterized protein n=1 Tax=Candidatus Nitrohelix vancouverensis TaxID=2705534 RepID=A0A7T0C2L1_9BACT|nr:MAG: hypothetical protein G3M78_08005 [Candidatus Nitrohelix vancouverensis]